MALANETHFLQRKWRVTGSGSIAVAMTFLACLLLVGAAAAAEPQVAIVVLPPAFIAESGDKATAAAELACDQLARELEKDPSLRVVDRSQLDHVLKERKLGASAAIAIMSYDAMIRLEIDVVRPVPVLRLRVVDLSNGNNVAESQYPWSVPLGQGVVAKMAQQCQAALPGLTLPRPNRLRVRLLEVENASRSARLEPLAARLRETFDHALERSHGIVLVHHLEAQTAKEESLLLTMGLSQLPDGRQFVPQSDATIELRIREMDGVGKTFDQTRVEVAWRIRKGQQYSGDWAVAAGAVNDFDSLLKTAWTRCAGTLGQATPTAAGDYLDEMALRRKQAQSELAVADAMRGSDGRVADPAAQIARLAAAVKIDPTFELAQQKLLCEQAAVQVNIATGEHPGDKNAKVMADLARQCVRYLDRFDDPDGRAAVMHSLGLLCIFGPLKDLAFDKQAAPLSNDQMALLDCLKDMCDRAASMPTDAQWPSNAHICVKMVYAGMMQAGVDIKARHEWIDRMIVRSRDQKRSGSLAFSRGAAAGTVICSVALKFAIDEAQTDRAKLLTRQLMADIPRTDEYWHSVIEGVRRNVLRLNDPSLQDEFDRWRKTLAAPVRFIRPTWPSLPNIANAPAVALKHVLQAEHTRPYPFARIGTRIYFLLTRDTQNPLHRTTSLTDDECERASGAIAYVDLDSAGLPSARINVIAPPATRKPLYVNCVAIVDGQLFLGTHGSGMLVYHPAENRWSQYGAEEGFARWNVQTILQIDDRTLFCCGEDEFRKGAAWTFDIKDKSVTLVHQEDNTGWQRWTRIQSIWKHDGKWNGITRTHFELDILGDAQMRPLPLTAGYGWTKHDARPNELLAAMTVGSRRFLSSTDGLHEIDAIGKYVRSWSYPMVFMPRGATMFWDMDNIGVPGDAPLPGQALAADERYIYFTDTLGRIGAFDPTKELWYGPVAFDGARPSSMTPIDGNLWMVGYVAGRNDAAFAIDREEIIRVSEANGLVVSTTEFQKRCEAALAGHQPLVKAQQLFGMRRFPEAIEVLAPLIEGDTPDKYALLLMGFIHDTWCLNRPDQAMQYYARLAAMQEYPDAVFTGLAAQESILARQKKWEKADEILKTIRDKIPQVDRNDEHWLRQQEQSVSQNIKQISNHEAKPEIVEEQRAK